MEKLQKIAKEAVEQQSKKDISNEAKKRSAFAFVNSKLAENNLTDNFSLQEIDDAIEEALR